MVQRISRNPVSICFLIVPSSLLPREIFFFSTAFKFSLTFYILKCQCSGSLNASWSSQPPEVLALKIAHMILQNFILETIVLWQSEKCDYYPYFIYFKYLVYSKNLHGADLLYRPWMSNLYEKTCSTSIVPVSVLSVRCLFNFWQHKDLIYGRGMTVPSFWIIGHCHGLMSVLSCRSPLVSIFHYTLLLLP